MHEVVAHAVARDRGGDRVGPEVPADRAGCGLRRVRRADQRPGARDAVAPLVAEDDGDHVAADVGIEHAGLELRSDPGDRLRVMRDDQLAVDGPVSDGVDREAGRKEAVHHQFGEAAAH